MDRLGNTAQEDQNREMVKLAYKICSTRGMIWSLFPLKELQNTEKSCQSFFINITISENINGQRKCEKLRSNLRVNAQLRVLSWLF